MATDNDTHETEYAEAAVIFDPPQTVELMNGTEIEVDVDGPWVRRQAERAEPSTASHSGHGERFVRDALDRCRSELSELRERRDDMNARIRILVEEEVTLAQAVGVFERREKYLAEHMSEDGFTK